MYVTNERCSWPVKVYLAGSSHEAYHHKQVTESWRTGKRTRGENPVTEPPNLSTGSLGERISARKKYIDQLGDTLSGPSSAPADGNRRYTHDTGHRFTTIKTSSFGVGTQYYDGKIILSGLPLGKRGGPPLGRSLTDRIPWYQDLGPSANASRDLQAGLFSSARPDAAIAGLGETIIELVSGNIPKLITRLGKNIANGRIMHQKLRDTGKDLGGDYLNQMFGWRPMINDFMSIIENGLIIHDWLYDTSYRRKRSTPVRNKVTYDSNRAIQVGVPFGALSYSNYGGISLGREIDSRFEYTWDMRLSSRFTRVRSSGSNEDHSLKALDALRRLGVWSPSLGWDLLPYSWLIDWFIHLGRGIGNYSTYSRTNGSFSTDYAYVTTKTVSQWNFPGHSGAIGRYSYVIDPMRTKTTTLSRVQGSPFGFGVSLGGLSSSQYAILVALGLAKSR